MSEKRKLQGEVDRTLKKANEGISEFMDLWEKYNLASTPNLKEKYEAELKKEIKKLQRHRDLIKIWATNPELREKKMLVEVRKQIEIQMEQFKQVEKGSKTKNFSREGLAAASADPEERMRADTLRWVQAAVGQLAAEITELENEVDALSSKKRKKDNELDRISILEEALRRHNFHVEKLTLISNLLSAKKIKPEDVNPIQTSVEYYLESYIEPDYVEDEFLYFELNLDVLALENSSGSEDQESQADDVPAGAASSVAPVVASSIATKSLASSVNLTRASPSNLQPTHHRGLSLFDPKQPQQFTPKGTKMALPKRSSPARTTKPTPTRTLPTASTTPTTASQIQPQAQVQASATTTPSASVMVTRISYGAAAAKGSLNATSISAGTTVAGEDLKGRSATAIHTHLKDAVIPASESQSGSHLSSATLKTATVPSQHPPTYQPTANQLATNDTIISKGQSQPAVHAHPHEHSSENSLEKPLNESQSQDQVGDLTSAAALGEAASAYSMKVHTMESCETAIGQLRNGLCNMTNVSDLLRARPYLPRNPVLVPHYVPSVVPPPLTLNPTFYTTCEEDTLFFIFYYMPGTYRQYLASRELKRKSWRFHKKYLTWFQRHEEPKEITDEYEHGVYTYFDFENTWRRRKKVDFSFEYKYLEDD